jgi:hypothetical protein
MIDDLLRCPPVVPRCGHGNNVTCISRRLGYIDYNLLFCRPVTSATALCTCKYSHLGCLNQTMITPDVTPGAPVDWQPTVGLIGMGAMGRMYARHLSEGGWKN